MSKTMPIELMPSWAISLTYCFQNMRKRSGTEKVRPIKMMNLPNVVSQLYSNFVISAAKVRRKNESAKRSAHFFMMHKNRKS